MRRAVTFIDTKNGDTRSVPVSGPAWEALQRRLSRPRLDTPLIFPSEDRLATFPRRAWDRARAEAGLPGLRFHDLRHTVASELAMSGATVSDLMRIMGWRSPAMAQRYVHLMPDHIREVALGGQARIFGNLG